MIKFSPKYLFPALFLTLTLVLFESSAYATQQDQHHLEVELPEIIVDAIPYSLEIILTGKDNSGFPEDTLVEVKLNGSAEMVRFTNGAASISHSFSGKDILTIEAADCTSETPVNPIPLWMSILPPLIAILMALLFREVYTALFIGLLVGTTIIAYYQGYNLFIAVFKGLFAIIDTYIIESLMDRGHLSVIIFSMLIGAMVFLITRNGGTQGVVNILSRYAKSPRSGQLVTWFLGILIFFDDYANTLVVGNTMRPVTDRLNISREKLAYIVDSTAAPIAAIAFVTTWIGAELGYIQDGITAIGIEANAYNVFLNSLAYSFYPIFTLIFILFLIMRKVDFGPMLYAERRARTGDITSKNDTSEIKSDLISISAEGERTARWYNAVIPVMIIVVGAFSGLFYTGWDSEVWNSDSLGFTTKISLIIGNSDSYKALLWASISGVIVALLLTTIQKIMTLKESIESLMEGFKTMLTAVFILTLAWAIALITQHMHTAEFISHSMLKLSLSPYFIPAITFFLAALVSFSTGSSWGTMAILYPLLLPAAWFTAAEAGLPDEIVLSLFYNVVSAVLAGSVLGDHCSPISDTTILSSLASSCNHIDHVRTQLPYAITVGIVAIGVGTIPSAFGIPTYILFPVGIVILYLIVVVLGRKTNVSKA